MWHEWCLKVVVRGWRGSVGGGGNSNYRSEPPAAPSERSGHLPGIEIQWCLPSLILQDNVWSQGSGVILYLKWWYGPAPLAAPPTPRAPTRGGGAPSPHDSLTPFGRKFIAVLFSNPWKRAGSIKVALSSGDTSSVWLGGGGGGSCTYLVSWQ